WASPARCVSSATVCWSAAAAERRTSRSSRARGKSKALPCRHFRRFFPLSPRRLHAVIVYRGSAEPRGHRGPRGRAWSAHDRGGTAEATMTVPATRPTLKPLLLVLLALLSSFTPLSIDMYLPALPVIAVDLHGTVGDIQLTLSAFMIAFGAGQIFYGPAGDRFGRRPVILGGLAVYVLASIGC